MKIVISEIISSELASFHDEGVKVYDLLKDQLDADKDVEVSFEKIQRCSTQFLNAAIGKLYLLGNPEKVDQHLKFDFSGLTNLQSRIEEVKLNALNSRKHDTRIANAMA